MTYGRTYGGTMTIKSATLASDNTVYAQLILDVGPKKVCETAHLLGVTSHLDCYAAEGLGGLTRGVTPLEMANAYATLASGGVRNKPKAIKRVVFPDGKSEDLGKPERKRVLTDGQAYAVTQILEANVLGGTGTAASTAARRRQDGHHRQFHRRLVRRIHPHLSTAVWVGYPDGRCPMEATRIGSVAGGTWPARIWHDFMTTAHGNNCDDFPVPVGARGVLAVLRQVRETGSADTGQYYGPGSETPRRRREVRPALLRGGAARSARDRDAAGAGDPARVAQTGTGTEMGTATGTDVVDGTVAPG